MSKRVKILYCVETISSGGVEKRRLLLAKAFDRSKYDLKIICTNSSGYINSQLLELGVEIISVGAFSSVFEFKKYRKVLEVVKEYKPDIIHGAVFEGMSMAFMGKVFGGVPILILEETSDPQFRSKKAILLQRLYSFFADKVIGIAPSVVRFLRENVTSNPSKVILINNGVDISNYCCNEEIQNLKNRLGIEGKDLIIGSVGRIHDKVKRFSDILHAIKRGNNKKLKFLLVGNGPDLDFLKELAFQLGLEDQFISVGFQSNPDKYFEIMDIFSLPSAHEGFGLAAAEAMLHKLPVIATKVGGLQDIVVDQDTGFLVPPYSPELIADKIQYLIDHPEVRKSMGEEGYQRAMEHYTAERYCREVEDLYLELLMKKGILI